MCPMPLPTAVLRDYTEYPMDVIEKDLLCLSVRAGGSFGDEFVKAGLLGTSFAPDVLISVRVGGN